MRGGKRAGAGRKPVLSHLKRKELSGFRIPQWIIEWVKKQPGSGGRIIEEALVKYYGLGGHDS